MDKEELFQQALALVESGESASLSAAIRHVAMVELSKEDGRNTREAARTLANEIWAVARAAGYEVA